MFYECSGLRSSPIIPLQHVVEFALHFNVLMWSTLQAIGEGMMATFEFLRLSLSVPTMGPLDNSKRKEPLVSRQQYIEWLFKTRIDFYYRRALFSFVPAESAALPPGCLAGFIGKQISEMENAGPETMFALRPHKTWKAAFITANANEGQQFVAVERRNDVGSSHSVIEHLIDARLSEYKSVAWHTDVEYVTQTRGFWVAASRYRGQITELRFEFNPPNGLKGFDKFKDFDRLAKAQTNSEKSEYALKNKQGAVSPDGEFVESAVEYASEGAGKAVLKKGNKKLYDSRESKKTATIPESVMPREGEETKVAGAALQLNKEMDQEGQDD